MADKINIEITGAVGNLEAAMDQAVTSVTKLENAVAKTGDTMKRVRNDSEAIEKAWGEALVESSKRTEAAVAKLIQTLDQGTAQTFSRVRNESELLEKAWGEALVESTKRADAAAKAFGKTLDDDVAEKFRRVRSESEQLEKSWGDALVENAKRAENAAKEASQASLQAANAVRSPWQAVSAGLRLVESEFGLVGIAAVGATVAIIGIAAALYELVASTGKAAIETDNLAARLGITDQQALKLQASSELAGISAHAFETNVRFLVEALDAGNASGAKTLKAIQDLGVATIDTSGAQREMGVVFLEILDKLSQVEDVNKRAAIAVEIFHRNALQIIPLIKNYQDYNAAVGDLGIGAHQNLTETLAAQGREVVKLSLAWENFKNEAAFTFGPLVTKVLDDLAGKLKIATVEVQLLTGNFAALKSEMISIGLIANDFKPTVAPIGGPADATTQQKAHFQAYIAGQEEMKEALQKRATAAKAAWEAELVTANQLIGVQHIQGTALDAEIAKVANLRGEYDALKNQLDAIKAAEEAARKAKQLELQTQRELNRLTEENIRGAGQVAEAWKRADAAGRNKKEGPNNELPTIDRSRSQEEQAKGEVAIAAAAKDLKTQVVQDFAIRVAQIRAEETAHYEEELNKQVIANEKYYAELQKKNEKAFTEGLIVQDRDLAAKEKNWKAALDGYNKYQSDLRRAADTQTATLIETNNKQYDVQKAAIEQQFKLFQINPKQRAQQENAAAESAYKSNLDAATSNVNSLNANPDASEEEKARAEKRLTDVISTEQKRRKQISAESIKQEVQLYDKAFTQIQGTFDKFISATLTGHQKIGQSLATLGRSMVADIAKTVANIGLQWAKMELGRVIFHKAANDQMTLMDIIKQQLGIHQAVAAEAAKKAAVAAVDTTTDIGKDAGKGLAKVAADAPAREASVAGDAAVAGAAAAAWTAASGDPEGAVPAGLAESALVEGTFAPMGFFEQGGLVSDNQLAFLHKNEMVLPANLSKGVQGMISGGSAGGGNGKNVTLHYHGYKGQDSESMKNDAGTIHKHIKKLARQGRL